MFSGLKQMRGKKFLIESEKKNTFLNEFIDGTHLGLAFKPVKDGRSRTCGEKVPECQLARICT
jgi:hypothetical protein